MGENWDKYMKDLIEQGLKGSGSHGCDSSFCDRRCIMSYLGSKTSSFEELVIGECKSPLKSRGQYFCEVATVCTVFALSPQIIVNKQNLAVLNPQTLKADCSLVYADQLIGCPILQIHSTSQKPFLNYNISSKLRFAPTHLFVAPHSP